MAPTYVIRNSSERSEGPDLLERGRGTSDSSSEHGGLEHHDIKEWWWLVEQR
jgi:hypothetical protein